VQSPRPAQRARRRCKAAAAAAGVATTADVAACEPVLKGAGESTDGATKTTLELSLGAGADAELIGAGFCPA